MAATQRLELRQSQSLVMTPQLQQAIKLLQFSNLELAAYVEKELELNPLLERDDGEELTNEARDGATADGIATPEDDLDRDRPSEDGSIARDSVDDLERSAPSDFGQDAPLDSDYQNLYNHDTASDSLGPSLNGGMEAWSSNGRGIPSDDINGYEQRLSQAPTLRQHLLDQIQLAVQDPGDRIIALHLLDMLDQTGYLSGNLATLEDQLNCSSERIEATVTLLQGLEPTGVFARSLCECLGLQLAEKDRLDPAMQALLDNLDLLAKKEFAALQKICGVDREDLVEMITEIRELNPKPALDFEVEPAEPLIPDVLMRALPNGKWFIELNPETLPRVLVNQSYYSEVSGQTRSKGDREYLSEHLQQATWLVKALHQRATTVLKVSREILRQQDAFFRKGIQHLRPLTLKDIAQTVEMHESTISRVTSNKYIATPRGIYELKYFFTAAIAGTAGNVHSAEAVRDRIRRLIDAESTRKILSDDTIVEILRGEGVDIARRTIAKYRESMRIPSSVQRRRDKSANI